MTLRYRFALLFALSLVLALLTACAPGVLAAIFGGVAAVAPVAVSAIDAYTATARGIAPAASDAELRDLVALLQRRDECTVTASAVLMPDAGAAPDVRDKALADSEAAVTALREAVRALTATAADAGREGGGA